ncbi:hypothetical protein [Streptomyces rubiginosohelvolus]|uniref:hypothetical protein n=1 Tax=Streptomyces rubiginosohelvolus TaxID=67362 RepID=UPI003651296A
MTHTDDARWSRSLRALFGEEMFAAVGARRRGDWRLDALDVMRSAKASSTAGSPDGPFGAVTPDDFTGVFPVSRSGAEQIVTTLQGEWFQADGIPDFSVRGAELTAHAGTVLGRFGRDALFFTNAVTARDDPHADMLRRDGAYEGFTGHVMDCGVIAVSATEVGVFWGFTIG